jgi:hypothetical protein
MVYAQLKPITKARTQTKNIGYFHTDQQMQEKAMFLILHHHLSVSSFHSFPPALHTNKKWKWM